MREEKVGGSQWGRELYTKERVKRVERMIVWVGECGKYYWSRKIYCSLNTEHLKTNKGFQEPSYFLFSPFCAKLFWQACLQVSQNIHKFRFYLGINPQRGSIKINWNAKAQLQLLQEIRSKLAVNLKCQCSAYLTFKCWNQCVLVLNTWKLWCIDWKLFTWLPFNRAVLAQNLFVPAMFESNTWGRCWATAEMFICNQTWYEVLGTTYKQASESGSSSSSSIKMYTLLVLLLFSVHFP